MNINFFSKTTLITTTLFLGILTTTQVTAASVNKLAGIKKDIRVISKVLESSTELKGSHARIHVSGNYFAKQGIVLKIRFPGISRFNVNFEGFGSIAPTPVIPDVAGDFSQEELDEAISEAMESAEEAMHETAEEGYSSHSFLSHPSVTTKEFRAQQKELRSQLRALRKQKKKLEKKARKIQIEEYKKSDEENKKSLKKIRHEIKNYSQQIKQKSLKIRNRLKQVRQKQQQAHISMVTTWTNNLLDNFCNYAPYPKNLPTDEYLTLVISDAVFKENNLEDKVIIINNHELASCRDGKSDGKALLSKALSYSF